MNSKKLVVAVDWDGTVVQNEFPLMGEPLPGAIPGLLALVAISDVIIWTCCEGEYAQEVQTFLDQHKVSVLGINVAHPDSQFESRKIYADVYIDDRTFLGFPGWKLILAWANLLVAMTPEQYSAYVQSLRVKPEIERSPSGPWGWALRV